MSTYNLKIKENETFEQYHVRLFEDMELHGLDSVEISKLLNDEYGSNYSESKWRKDYASYRKWKDFLVTKEDENTVNYKESSEILKDGSYKSDKLIQMNSEQSKNTNYLLEVHGFDPKVWELLNAKNNIWNVSNGDNPNKTLYSSKITVKPIKDAVNFDELIKKFKENIKESKLNFTIEESENILVIPLFDMHFGISTFECYEKQLYKIIKIINSKKRDKILIVFGQDALHTDGFNGQTSSGTMIGHVDFEKAWGDLHKFYTIIFDNAIKNSKSVDAIFSNGNHDKSVGWTFGKLLENQYPQVKFDTKMKQFKGYTWNNIFLGFTHGDKGQARIFDVYLAEYGKLISAANTKEIITGHYHFQKTIDKYGLVHRAMGTAVPSDSYHSDNGFIGAKKQFQLLEYNENDPEVVYYI